MRMPRLIVLSVLALLITAAPAMAQRDRSWPREQQRAIYRAFDRGDYERAASLIESYLEHRPNDAGMLYNLACAYAQLDRKDDAASALLKSVRAGYRDFEHMKRDPDLESIRGEELYKAILEAAQQAQTEGAEETLARWKATYGEEGYRFEIDEKHKLAFAAALDDESYAWMLDGLKKEADHLINTLFDEAPPYYVLIAVPTPEHADAIIGDPEIGGRYEHGRRRLITRDIGGSLRHEFVHAYHFAHMERLGLRRPHPLWIQEGLATLYEDYEIEPDGTFTFVSNKRHNIVRRRARLNLLMDWRDFFELSADRFMDKASWTYPQTRSIFEFIADRGKLRDWYRAYVDNYTTDRTGVRAFEVAFGRPLEEIEDDWKKWVLARPEVDVRIVSNDAALGVTSVPNSSNDGILIDEVLPGSAAARARLRSGDVIVAIDDRPTRTMEELQRVIGSRRVGDRVEVRARRRGEYFTVTAVLRPLRGDIR
jgi:tetratricopeptide (TPR) repeat protein